MRRVLRKTVNVKVMKTFPPSFQSARDKNHPTKKDPISVFPSVDMRAKQIPPPPYTATMLDMQEVEVMKNIIARSIF